MNFKGQVHGRVIDRHTGEIRHEFEQDNIVIGGHAIDRFTRVGVTFFHSGSTYAVVHQYIGGRKLVADLPNMHKVPPNIAPASQPDKHWIQGSAVPISPPFPTGGTWQVTPAGGGNPWFVESTYQWDPPGVGDGDRTTWTVGVNNFGNQFPFAYVVLNSACVQREDLDVLLVTYRISFLDSGPVAGSDFTRINYDPVAEEGLNKTLARTAAREGGTPSSTPNDVYTSEGILGINANHGNTWNPNLPTNDLPFKYARTGNRRFVGLGTTGIHDWVRDKIKYAYSWDETDDIGRIYGSTQWMGAATGTDSNDPDNIHQAAIWTTATPSNFPNKPIQVIHNHSAFADRPFLDSLTLASGAGTFVVGGSSWDKTVNMPQFWRVDIVNSGDVGTSRYHVRARSLIGFSDLNTYSLPQSTGSSRGTQEPVGWLSRDDIFGDARSNRLDSNIWAEPRTFWEDTTGAVTSSPRGGLIEYGDDYHYMAYCSQETRDAFTLFNFLTGWNRTFHSATTPALPVSGLIQVESDAAGNIWVADPTAGLFKITDPLGAPTVTTVLPSTLSVPAGTPPVTIDDTICYGVHPGNGGSVWALMHGSMVKTTDGGTTWTHHYPGSLAGGDGPDYSVSGLTDDGTAWAKSRLVKVDIDSTDFEMGICRYNAENDVNVHWWSPISGDVGIGAPDVGADQHTFIDISDNPADGTPFFPTYVHQESFTVSKRGGGFFASSHNNRAQGALFGDANFKILTTGGFARHRTIPRNYVYDLYGKPHVYAYGNEAGFGSPVNVRGFWGSEHGGGGTADGGDIEGVIQGDNVSSYGLNTKFGFEMRLEGGTSTIDSWTMNSLTLEGSTDQGGGGDLGQNNVGQRYQHNDTLNTDGSYFQELVWNDYRWDPVATAWKLWWNTDAIDTSAAANGYNATRVRFNVEDHAFIGRSRIDASVALDATGTPVPHTSTIDFVPYGAPAAPGAGVALLPGAAPAFYFILNDDGPLGTGPYYVWFTSGPEFDPTPFPAPFGIMVTIAGPDSSDVIATLTAAAIDAHLNPVKVFSAPIPPPLLPIVTVTTVVNGLTTAVAVGTMPAPFPILATPSPGVSPVNEFSTANDMTFVATVNSTSKAPTTDPEGRNSRNKYCLLSLTDGTWRDCINFYWSNVGNEDTPDGTGSVSIEFFDRVTTNSSTEHVFGATPAVGVDTRIVLVIDGTASTATCYVDGAVLGTAAAIPPGVAGAAEKMYIGATAAEWKHHVTDFFKGTLTNIQIWDVPFTVGDVIADHGAGTPWTGVVVPGGASESPNLITRYELNQSLVAAETRATHFSTESLPDGLDIAFSNGSFSPAFVDTDYYTFGVCDGILKDNAISFSLEFEAHGRSVDYNVTDLEDTVNDPAGSPVLIPAAGLPFVDSLVPMRNDTGQSANDIAIGGRFITGAHSYAHSQAHGADNSFPNTFQRATGACAYEMTTGHNYGVWGFGLTETPLTQSTAGTDYSLEFTTDPPLTVTVRESGSVPAGGSAVTTWDIDDTFRIERSGGGTVTYKKNGGTFFTSLVISAGDIWGRFMPRSNEDWNLYDVKFEWDRPGLILDLGLVATLKGKYHPDYWMIDNTSIDVTIAGSPVTVVIDESSRIEELLTGGANEPGPGTCVAVPDAGYLVFNVGDIGDAVTVSYTLIRFK